MNGSIKEQDKMYTDILIEKVDYFRRSNSFGSEYSSLDNSIYVITDDEDYSHVEDDNININRKNGKNIELILSFLVLF